MTGKSEHVLWTHLNTFIVLTVTSALISIIT